MLQITKMLKIFKIKFNLKKLSKKLQYKNKKNKKNISQKLYNYKEKSKKNNHNNSIKLLN